MPRKQKHENYAETEGVTAKDARELFEFVCEHLLGIENPDHKKMLNLKPYETVSMEKVFEFVAKYPKLRASVRVYYQPRKNKDSKRISKDKFEDLFE